MSEVAIEYGQALYELASDESAEQQYLDELRGIDALLCEYPEYVRLLGAPNVPIKERQRMLDESFGGRCEEYILSFLKLMVERGYAYFLRECITVYEDIYLERHGVVRARVRVAKPLDEQRLEKLRARLEAYSQKKVEMKVTVDPTLIGGIRVELDGKLLEGDVRSRLDKMRSDMANITL